MKGEIGLVEERQGRINIHQLKQEVTTEIKKLEDKIETIKEAYEEQESGLVEGGNHIRLIETI